MRLSIDQKKAVNSLITNTLINDYAEIHEELCDHFAIGIEAYMQKGISFTDSMNLMHEEFGGDRGLQAIEYKYEKEIKKLGKALYKKFASGYFGSFRWLIPVLFSVLLVLVKWNYPNFPLNPLNLFMAFAAIFYTIWNVRNWRLEKEKKSYYGEKRSLKEITIHQLYIPMMLMLPILITFSNFSIHFPRNFYSTFWSTLITSLIYMTGDFYLSFISYAKKNWLFPKVANSN